MKQLKRLQLNHEKRIGAEELKNLRGGDDMHDCFCIGWGYMLLVFNESQCEEYCGEIGAGYEWYGD